MKIDSALLCRLGADRAAAVPASAIPIDFALRDSCVLNHCGSYGKNYTCPPLVGEPPALAQKLARYRSAVIFQKVYALSDSFDIEGMRSANDNFHSLVQHIQGHCRKNYSGGMLVLGAGACRLCKQCAAADYSPCRYPGQAAASLEAYCIQVSALAELCGLPYLNGKNTVTYFGGVFIY